MKVLKFWSIISVITLTPSSEEYGPNYESGQITIAFSPGNEDSHTTVKGGVVLGAYPSARYYGIKSVSQNHGWSLAYHRFGVIWKTGKKIYELNYYSRLVLYYKSEKKFTNVINILFTFSSRYDLKPKLTY